MADEVERPEHEGPEEGQSHDMSVTRDSTLAATMSTVWSRSRGSVIGPRAWRRPCPAEQPEAPPARATPPVPEPRGLAATAGYFSAMSFSISAFLVASSASEARIWLM